MQHRYSTFAIATVALCASATSSAKAEAQPSYSAVYSMDSLKDHPYRFYPAYGHASQNPGSPKWFAPGYGYQIPGFGTPPNRLHSMHSNHWAYPFGNAVRPWETASRSRHWNGNTSWWLLPGTPSRQGSPSFNW